MSLAASLPASAAETNPFPAYTSVTVSVGDLDKALALWSGLFGFEIIASKQGPDPELAAIWGLQATDIARQALLLTPGPRTGMLHLVQFSKPGAAVRDHAEVFDLVPKNLDVYASDLPQRVEELKAAGLVFRNDTYSEVTAPDGTKFLEIHLPAHDKINIVLLEVLGKELPFTERGFAGIGPLVTIVADAGKEREFYSLTMNQTLLNDNLLEGPEIERMVGLPPGSALDVSIWGMSGQAKGQMEVIDYRGVEGKNLYPLTIPMHRGILHVAYESANLDEFTERLNRNGIAWKELGKHSTLVATGRYIEISSPAGLRIEVFQASD